MRDFVFSMCYDVTGSGRGRLGKRNTKRIRKHIFFLQESYNLVEQQSEQWRISNTQDFKTSND